MPMIFFINNSLFFISSFISSNFPHIPEDNWFRDSWLRPGIILTWVRTGGPEGTVWEILYSDGDTEYWDENDLEVISECR